MRPSSQLSRSLEDIPTEILIQSFSDRILVLITQVGKVGNLIQATIPPTASLLPPAHPSESEEKDVDDISNGLQSLPSPPPSIQLMPLLGSAPTEHIRTLHSMYASQTATLVWIAGERLGEERKPIVVGVALKKGDTWDEGKERKMFMGVMQMVNELLDGQSAA